MPNALTISAIALLLGQAQPGPGAANSGARIPAMIAESQEAQLSMNQGMRRTVDILREARQGAERWAQEARELAREAASHPAAAAKAAAPADPRVVGARVEAKAANDKWWPATITKARLDGTFDLQVHDRHEKDNGKDTRWTKMPSESIKTHYRRLRYAKNKIRHFRPFFTI